MKCIEAEKSILLQDSGELGAGRIRGLEEHLSGCASCRRFKQVLLESANAFDAGREPPTRVVQDVLRAARTAAPEHKHLPVFGWKPAMIMASGVIIAIGLFLGTYTPNRVGMEIDITDAQLLGAEDQVVSVMYEGLSEDDLAFNFLMTYDEELEG